jgi:hypothetical protein
MSNSEQIKGNWNELKERNKICRTYRRRLFDEGKEDEMGKLQLGKTEKKLNHYLTFSLFINKRKLFHENYIYFETERRTSFLKLLFNFYYKATL